MGKQSRPGSRMKADQGKSLAQEELSRQTDKQEEMSEEETARPSSRKQMSRPGSKMKEDYDIAQEKKWSRPGSKMNEEKGEALNSEEVEILGTASSAKKQFSRPGSKMKTEVSEEETVRPASRKQML